jgi:hypothetical protein
MPKLNKNLIRGVGIGSGLIAIILGFMLFRQSKPQLFNPMPGTAFLVDPFLEASLPEASDTRIADPRPTKPLPPSAIKLPSPTPEPTPIPPWMEFSGLSLLGGPVLMRFEPACGDGDIYLPEFRVLPWRPDILASGEFELSMGTVVSWEHLGYNGLWMHSGLDWLGTPQSAFALQEYLERHESGRLNTPGEFDLKAGECLIGSRVIIEIGGEMGTGTVSAVARVPAEGVQEVSGHVMDLVPYLAETYPESGFAGLEEGGLVLYFCGRQLSTESADMTSGYYSQTRIIVGISP